MEIIKLLIGFIIAYLIGSINFAILILQLQGKGDPRKLQSGNAGTSNVFRVAGAPWAAVVLILDISRALGVAALALHFFVPATVTWIGLALILGNRFPCFHGFQGGKGVANYLGFTAFISPITAILACVAWVSVFMIIRVTFIPSFCMIGTLMVGTSLFFEFHPVSIFGTALTGMVIYLSHKKNIKEYIEKRSDSR